MRDFSIKSAAPNLYLPTESLLMGNEPVVTDRDGSILLAIFEIFRLSGF